ncbi:hypothetical protein [Streptomyces pseudogriseolus]|uniref:hypothetical protein n=1 Tax=Streptomyces pseudogriseolus TaxID=36817 RepID=UPI00167351DF|nr:hypothetical protein [Streptomyces pseudogriseolus]
MTTMVGIPSERVIEMSATPPRWTARRSAEPAARELPRRHAPFSPDPVPPADDT